MSFRASGSAAYIIYKIVIEKPFGFSGYPVQTMQRVFASQDILRVGRNSSSNSPCPPSLGRAGGRGRYIGLLRGPEGTGNCSSCYAGWRFCDRLGVIPVTVTALRLGGAALASGPRPVARGLGARPRDPSSSGSGPRPGQLPARWRV